MTVLETDARCSVSQAPTLPAAVRLRLGALLGDAYASCETRPPVPASRFEDLLKRLERAFAELGVREEEAFRREFLELTPRLQRFAMSLTKNPAAADDLVQDTMLRAWRSRGRFEAGTNLGAWLFTIMRNALYSQHRKRSHEAGENGMDFADRLATLPEQPGHLDLQDANAALAQLPDPMRKALVLVAIDNLSYEEAATVMGCRIGTVKSRVWRAREQLAVILGFNAGDVGADGTTLSVLAGARATGVP